MALAVFVKQPVVENTAVMPVENLFGMSYSTSTTPFAATGRQICGVTAPSAGAAVALNTIRNPALAPATSVTRYRLPVPALSTRLLPTLADTTGVMAAFVLFVGATATAVVPVPFARAPTIDVCKSAVVPLYISLKFVMPMTFDGSVRPFDGVSDCMGLLLPYAFKVTTSAPLLSSCASPRWPVVNVGSVLLYTPPIFAGLPLSVAPDATFPPTTFALPGP